MVYFMTEDCCSALRKQNRLAFGFQNIKPLYFIVMQNKKVLILHHNISAPTETLCHDIIRYAVSVSQHLSGEAGNTLIHDRIHTDSLHNDS